MARTHARTTTTTSGAGVSTPSTPRKAGPARDKRRNITTGLIQSTEVTGLANITDTEARMFADALLLACNTAIASESWGKMKPLDFVNVVVGGYESMSHRT